MNNEIQISVIVPIYNIENYLEKCLDSLKNQTFTSYEVILVNDGSTDKSGEMAEEYAEKNKDLFSIVHQENKGLSEARNTGLQYAKGKYICFVDSDDYVEKEYLQNMYQCAVEQDADLVICAFQSVDECGNVLKKVYENGFEPNKVYSLDERKDLLLTQNAAWNKMYKKEIIEKHGLRFTPGVWYEDLRFVKKYMLYAEKFVYCDSILLNYLIRQGSIMNSMGSKRNVEIIDAIDELISFYKKENAYEKFSAEIEFLAIDHMYISTLVRLIRAGEKKQLLIIRNAFKERFSNFKKNIYIPTLDKKRKLIFTLLNLKCYGFIKIIFDVRERKNEK